MKRALLLTSIVLLSLAGFSQAVSCDLSISNADITTLNGQVINANDLSANSDVRMQVLIGNFVSGNIVPAGHLSLRIGLGTGLVLDPAYNLATAPLSNYFSFSYDVTGPQPQIIGTLIAPLPADFTEFAYFILKANAPVYSSISYNLAVTNPPGTTTPLSDPESINNNAATVYAVSGILLPVTFAGMSAAVTDCDVHVSWNVKGEENLSHYDVEISKNGTSYNQAASVTSRNAGTYNATISLTELLKSAVLYVRIKSVDKDGKFAYSEVKMVKGQCEQSGNLHLSLYPNPVSGNFVVITVTDGSFNGKYSAILMDQVGKVYANREIELNNRNPFKFNLDNLAAGSYLINLISHDKISSTVLKFTKL